MRIKRSTACLFLFLVLIVSLTACQDFQRETVNLDELLATANGSSTPTTLPISEEVGNQLDTSSSSGFLTTNQTQWYLDQAGTCRVVGLVRNDSDQTVNNIQVEVQFFDRSDTLLLSDTISTALYTLTPGETTPFLLWSQITLPSVDHVTSKVVAYSGGEIERAEVEVRGVTLTLDDNYDVHITGELYNKNLDPVVIYGIAAASFDSRGNLLAADSHSVGNQYLDPGEFGPFRVTMIKGGEASLDIASHMLFIDVGIVPPEDFFDLHIHEGPKAYLDGNGAFHLVGEITNNSEYSLYVNLLASIYNQDEKVIDASSTNLPIFSIAPGETLPFEFDDWGAMSKKKGTLEHAWKYSVQWNPFLTWSNEIKYVTLSTQNQVHNFNKMDGIFSGEVINDSGFLLTNATVIISFFDQTTGQILAMDYETIGSGIPAGDPISYEIVVDFDQNLDIDATNIVTLAVGEYLE